MFDAFDIIRVINLPSRRDRRAQMLRELARVGIARDPRVLFFDAIRPNTKGAFSSVGAHGVYQSHLAVLQEAVSKNASVLVLEDDCVFAADADRYKLDETFAIFYGGYWASEPGSLMTSDIIGAHMMGFSADGAKAVLSYLRTLNLDRDHPPIDAAYIWFRRAHPEITTIFADPPVGHQRPSRSDIEPGRFYNRVFGLRWLVEQARRFRLKFQDVAKLKGKPG